MNPSRLLNEKVTMKEGCSLCKESTVPLWSTTNYGAVVVYRVGTSENGWFATVSPNTGSDPRKDFTIQVMPLQHYTHFAQVAQNKDLAKNYGEAFAQMTRAMTLLMSQRSNPKEYTESKEEALPVATYGKCTNWVEKKEHLHVKIFPFTGDVGQPYTVDSSYGKKEVFTEPGSGEKYVKMKPVTKKKIQKERLKEIVVAFQEILQ